jgi:hypothetical protein
VWYEICKWLGVVIVMPSDIMTLFYCFCGLVRNKKVKKRLSFGLAYGDLVSLASEKRCDFQRNFEGASRSS